MDQPTAPNQPASGHNFGLLYGYVPTEWVCGVFIAFFGMSTLVHLVEAFYFRLYWLLPTAVIAGVAEVIGWSGRLWSSKNPTALNPYLMQITTTILAPTPLVAANFIILGILIKRMGTRFSRLSPNMYAIVFCSADIIALVVQAIGGASASEAVQQFRDPEKGGHIMLGGIAFQMASIILYVFCAAEFFIRFSYDRPIRRGSQDAIPQMSSQNEPSGASTGDTEKEANSDTELTVKLRLDKKTKLMLLGLSFSTLCIFIRSVYRTIELTNGFDGPIIHTQQLFNFLDGTMIILAMICLNVLHPGWLLVV